MANIKISELNELYEAQKDYNDYVPVVDTSADETKKISVKNLIRSNVQLIAVTDTEPAEYETGDKYYNTTDNRIYTATSSGWANAETPIRNIFYVVISDKTTYTYDDDNETLISVGGGASGGGETLPVGSEIDFDGSVSDIPDGWEQVTPTVQTLWTNSSPTSGFTAQTIELSSSDYNYLEIYFRTFTNQDLVKSVKIEKGQNALLDCAFLFGTRNYLGTRAVTYTDATHLAIGEGRTIIQDNNLANSVDNGWVIPIKIIGIKEV